MSCPLQGTRGYLGAQQCPGLGLPQQELPWPEQLLSTPGLAGSQRREDAGLTLLCSEHETNEAEAADLWLPAGQQFQSGTWPLCGSEMWPQVAICSIPLSVPSLLPTSCNRTLGPPHCAPSPPGILGEELVLGWVAGAGAAPV